MQERKTLETLLGVIIIGRNEGERLVRCLASVIEFGGHVVYVDSGSTDDSVAAAHAVGVQVIELDMTQPFTAARARNAGMQALGLSSNADKVGSLGANAPEFIQFIDGDCEMRPNWFEAGIAFLQAHPDVAIVSGRLRERHPENSVYNALCDSEWDGPLGETNYCGGIAMMRSAALKQTDLFNARMIAGEEPELCARLIEKGWKIWRIQNEMAWHDVAMVRFGQFWARMRRGGFAYALWANMQGVNRLGKRLMRRALFWGAFAPGVILLTMILVSPWTALLLLIYPVQIIHFAQRGQGWSNATLLVLAKFAEAKGIIEFYWSTWRGRPSGLIEHKQPQSVYQRPDRDGVR